MPALRDDVVEMLRQEIVGPSWNLPGVQTGVDAPRLRNEEILRAEDPPRVRYGAGILFPGGARVQAQDDVPEGEIPDAAEDQADGKDPGAENTNVMGEVPQAENDSVTDLEVNRANEYLPSALGLTGLRT